MNFIKAKGRIGRIQFLIICAITAVLIFLAKNIYLKNISYPKADLIFIFAIAMIAYVYFTFIIKRLHDIGKSGMDIWKLLLPIYNLFLIFLLFVKPGVTSSRVYETKKIHMFKV